MLLSLDSEAFFRLLDRFSGGENAFPGGGDVENRGFHLESYFEFQPPQAFPRGRQTRIFFARLRSYSSPLEEWNFDGDSGETHVFRIVSAGRSFVGIKGEPTAVRAYRRYHRPVAGPGDIHSTGLRLYGRARREIIVAVFVRDRNASSKIRQLFRIHLLESSFHGKGPVWRVKSQHGGKSDALHGQTVFLANQGVLEIRDSHLHPQTVHPSGLFHGEKVVYAFQVFEESFT